MHSELWLNFDTQHNSFDTQRTASLYCYTELNYAGILNFVVRNVISLSICYSECRCTDCCIAEFRFCTLVMLSVLFQIVIMLIVTVLIVTVLIVIEQQCV